MPTMIFHFTKVNGRFRWVWTIRWRAGVIYGSIVFIGTHVRTYWRESAHFMNLLLSSQPRSSEREGGGALRGDGGHGAPNHGIVTMINSFMMTKSCEKVRCAAGARKTRGGVRLCGVSLVHAWRDARVRSRRALHGVMGCVVRSNILHRHLVLSENGFASPGPSFSLRTACIGHAMHDCAGYCTCACVDADESW